MGMAASQARFLGLTARKSNTEYQGQQVNQQRTALANQSAGLYNQMLALEVPTPPSASNYYTIRYTYSYDGEDYEIVSQTPQSDGKYTVKTKVSYEAPVATKVYLSGEYTRSKDEKGDYSYTYGGVDLEETKNATLAADLNLSEDYVFYQYQNADGDLYYIKHDTVEGLDYDEEGKCQATTEQYYQTTGTKTRYENIKDATFDTDSSGRYTKIHYKDGEVEVDKDLTMTEVQDSTGYDEAMNEYYYKKDVYDKTIEDINAQTEIIQQQDRTLELRLKQLDTEEKALKTELDAVQEVIKTNVEKTFKTFSA